jgi:hypothetical protein
MSPKRKHRRLNPEDSLYLEELRILKEAKRLAKKRKADYIV